MDDITVLCVTPETDDAPTSGRLADRPAVSVVERSSLSAAKDVLADGSVDCLVTAYDLPDGTGTDLIRLVREVDPDTGCILFTDADRERIAAGTDGPLVAEYVDREGPEAVDRLAALATMTARRRTQAAYPLPDEESERLAAVARLTFDSPSLDRAFDRVTTLAAEHFDVERSAVNVVDEHTQEVLACHGADWTTIPREETICTYTILDEGVTVVEDTAADPRFEANEALDDLDIRFYAGAPLATDDGLPIGTLCIYAEEPRELSDAEAEYLRLLADEAIHWIELHARLSRSREGEASEVSR